MSGTGRSTREIGAIVTPLESSPAQTRWIWAGPRCASVLMTGGELLIRSRQLGSGGHDRNLRSKTVVAMPQG